MTNSKQKCCCCGEPIIGIKHPTPEGDMCDSCYIECVCNDDDDDGCP
jgi:hypothetical protein